MKSVLKFAFLLSAILTFGCQLTPNFKTGYRIDAVKLRPTPMGEKLAVHRFEEARVPRVYSTSGRLFLTYIPLIPYITMPFERLDESVRIQSDNIKVGGRGFTLGARQNVAPDFEEYTYPASMAKAIAEDLAATGLFRAVAYVGAAPAQACRYQLTGIVRETPFNRTATSYMLGMPGVLLWFAPIPLGKITARINVDLTLTDTRTSQIVWKKTLESKVTRLITLYTSSAMVYGQAGAFSLNIEYTPSNSGVDRRSLFGWHFEALRRAMIEAKPELARALADRQ